MARSVKQDPAYEYENEKSFRDRKTGLCAKRTQLPPQLDIGSRKRHLPKSCQPVSKTSSLAPERAAGQCAKRTQSTRTFGMTPASLVGLAGPGIRDMVGKGGTRPGPQGHISSRNS